MGVEGKLGGRLICGEGGEERKKGVDGGVRAPTLLSTEQPRMWMHRQSLFQPEESVSRMNFLLIARSTFVGA